MAQRQDFESWSSDDFNSEDKSASGSDLKDQTTVTLCGKIKTFARLERDEVIFITISSINALITVALTIDRMIKSGRDSSDFTFGIILLINVVWCLYYAIHGVLREREFELYVYIVAVIIIFIYLVVNLAVNSNDRTTKWVRLAIFLVLAPMNIYLGWKVGAAFGFLEFRTVGAAEQLQRMYRAAGRFSMLLKFDLQLAVTLVVLVIKNPESLTITEKIIVGVGLPVQVFWALLGWIAMRRELKLLVYVFLLVSLAEPAYIIYRTVKIVETWKEQTDKKGDDVLTYCYLGVAILAFVVRILCLVSLKFVVQNFKKGLRELVPVTGEQAPLLPRKRDIKRCCGMVCCGPFG